jgi:hypothetical protein
MQRPERRRQAVESRTDGPREQRRRLGRSRHGDPVPRQFSLQVPQRQFADTGPRSRLRPSGRDGLDRRQRGYPRRHGPHARLRDQKPDRPHRPPPGVPAGRLDPHRAPVVAERRSQFRQTHHDARQRSGIEPRRPDQPRQPPRAPMREPRLQPGHEQGAVRRPEPLGQHVQIRASRTATAAAGPPDRSRASRPRPTRCVRSSRRSRTPAPAAPATTGWPRSPTVPAAPARPARWPPRPRRSASSPRSGRPARRWTGRVSNWRRSGP